MPTFRFVPTDIRYRNADNTVLVSLYGRNQLGERMVVIDSSFSPSFLVTVTNTSSFLEKTESLNIKGDKGSYEVIRLEEVGETHEGSLHRFKVTVNSTWAVGHIASYIKNLESVSGVYEDDIPFIRKYLNSKDITLFVWHEVEGEQVERRFRARVIVRAERITRTDEYSTNLKVLSLMVMGSYARRTEESSEEPITSIMLKGDGIDKLYCWKRSSSQNPNREMVMGEAELITRAVHTIRTYDPDVIVGYLSDQYDWAHLKSRARKYGINLELGLDYSEVFITKGLYNQAIINGICHLDLAHFMRSFMPRYIHLLRQTSVETPEIFTRHGLAHLITSLRTIPTATLKEEERDYQTKLEEYISSSVNSLDEVFNAVLPLLIELMKLTSLSPQEIIRMDMHRIIDAILVRYSMAAGELVPARRKGKQAEEPKSPVFMPKRGVFDEVYILDSRVILPKIMVEKNISPGTVRCSCCASEHLGEEFWTCSKKKDFILIMLDALLDRRDRIRDIMQRRPGLKLAMRLTALSILLQQVPTYLADARARWHSKDYLTMLRRARTSFVQEVKDLLDESTLLYQGRGILMFSDGDVRSFKERLKSTVWGDTSIAGPFPHGFFMPEVEGHHEYALVTADGTLLTRGVQRRSGIARFVQGAVDWTLKALLNRLPAEEITAYLEKVVERVVNHEMPIENMVISSVVTKPLDTYETVTPAVAAARRMNSLGMAGNTVGRVEYVVMEGDDSLPNRVRLAIEISPSDYDAEYYIQHQLIPMLRRLSEVGGFELPAFGDDQARLDTFIP